MNRINIGVIGFGGRGQFFCREFSKDPKCRLVAIAEPATQRRDMAHDLYPNAGAYAEVGELLVHDSVDAVVVASADQAHYENTLQVLKHRKHVLLEKPMAQTVRQCDDLITTWHHKAKDRVFMVGLELRYCSLFTRMKELIEDGAIGKVIVGMAVDNVSVGEKYFFHNNYSRKSFVGSLLLQKGVHTLDLVNWFMGSRPQKVYATGGLNVFGGEEPNDKRCSDCGQSATCPYVLRETRVVGGQDFCVFSQACDVDDNSHVIIEYEDNTRATYTECHFTPEYTREFTFIGDRGKMYGFYNNAGGFLIRISRRFTNDIEEHHPAMGRGAHGGGDQGLFEEFLTCVAEGKQPLHSIVSARDSTAVAAAATESIELGMPVEIPPCPVNS